MAKDPNETQEGAQEGTTEHDGDETEIGEEKKYREAVGSSN
jgi:hypothetical protein